MRGCAPFSIWNSPHHGRPKTVENNRSNIRYNKINITFSDRVIVENIISGNVIIAFLRMIFSTITQSGNVIFILYSLFVFVKGRHFLFFLQIC